MRVGTYIVYLDMDKYEAEDHDVSLSDIPGFIESDFQGTEEH